MDAVGSVLVLLGALVIDATLGDPPNRWHPVAWMGAALERGRLRLAHGSAARLTFAGAVVTVGVAALAGVIAVLVVAVADRLGVAGRVLESVALSALLSVRGLVRAARAVGAELARGDLPGARATVAFHLVSRPTGDLDEPQVVSATIESVAENLTDSVLGPACFYLALGLPGAAVYRAVNTADAMIGYRDGALEYFGKVAARLDDVFNLLPARLAGVAIVAAAGLTGADTGRARRIMCRDARRTSSPNAGWPMAAMAGALGVTLEKRGAYRLGGGAPPSRADIERAVAMFMAASIIGLGVLIAIRLVLVAIR
jgi:adenosylcobinamide-phosphate synthase